MVNNLILDAKAPGAKKLLVTTDDEIEIEHLISRETVSLFHLLSEDRESKAQDFLCTFPDEWGEDPSYVFLLKRAKNLKVVNDSAERAISLLQQYNLSLSKSESPKQSLLHGVSKHRKKHPIPPKKSFK